MLMKEIEHNGGGENIQFGDTFIDDKFCACRMLCCVRRIDARARGKGEAWPVIRSFDLSGEDAFFALLR
jgi:type I restriction enzyme M protein